MIELQNHEQMHWLNINSTWFHWRCIHFWNEMNFTTTQGPKSTSRQPLQQLLRSPGAAPGFHPMPLAERRTTLRTKRLSGPGERLRQSHGHRGRDWWGCCCASLHWPRPATCKMWIWKKLRIARPAPRPLCHLSYCDRGWDWWGSCSAALHWLMPAICKMWHLKEIENWKTRASTPLSPISLERRSRLVRVLLCLIALAKACDAQNVNLKEIKNWTRASTPLSPILLRPRLRLVRLLLCGIALAKACAVQNVKSERNWELQDPGLDPLITNLIPIEVEIGEGLVVLHCIG